MIEKIKYNLKEVFLVLIIILVSSFFRFYNFKELFHFSLDEEFWSYLIQRIIVYKDLPLIGGEISSTKIFTGPLFVYFHVPLFILSRLSPLIGGYFWSGIGVITAVLVYFFGKRFFNQRIGFFAAVFYSASFSMALFDRRFWNVSPIPIVSLLSIWLLILFLKGKRFCLIILALVISFGLQSHFSALAVLLPLLFIFLNGLKPSFQKFKFFKKEVLIAGSLFLILNLGPLVAFDLRHDFWNAKALNNLVTTFGQPKPSVSNANPEGIFQNLSRSLGSLVYLGKNIDVANEMSHCAPIINSRPHSPILIQMLSLIILGWILFFSFRDWGNPLSQFIIGLTAINLFGLLIYREGVFTYHFAPLMPFFFLYLGKLVDLICRKTQMILGGLILIVFVSFNTFSLMTASSQLGFTAKEQIVKTIIEQTKDEKIAVSFFPACEIYGYRYLFTALGKPVASSWIDYVLAWLYPEELSEEINTRVEVFVPDQGRGKDYQKAYTESEKKADKKIDVDKITIFFFSLPEQKDNSTIVY